jgi:hypothetical protein
MILHMARGSSQLLASGRVFQASDLRRDRSFIDEARDNGAARLRDTDGTSFVMVKESDLGVVASERDVLETLLEATEGALRLEAALHAGGAAARVVESSPWPWLAVFDDEDLQSFIADVVAAVAYGRSERGTARLEEEVAAWLETARAMSDPARHAALTEPIDLGRFHDIAAE